MKIIQYCAWTICAYGRQQRMAWQKRILMNWSVRKISAQHETNTSQNIYAGYVHITQDIINGAAFILYISLQTQ